MKKSQNIFIAINIGSRSKKYSIYSNHQEITSITISEESKKEKPFSINNFLKQTMSVNGFELNHNTKLVFGVRIVAPGTFFTKHRVINQQFIKRLEKNAPLATLHITPTLKEIKSIRRNFPKSKIIAVSDSNFHLNRPDQAKNYPLNKQLIKKFDLYKFGYHGLAHLSAINQLKSKKLLMPKTIICHLGGGRILTVICGGT